MAAAPSTKPIIADVFDAMLGGDRYKALRRARKLLAYEERFLTLRNAPAVQSAA